MSSADPFFDPLLGVVRVPAEAPVEWRENGLDEFYAGPNDERWGRTLCRVLYHESLHYWQVFSSGYIANLVAEDWQRLLEFEKTGQVRSHSEFAARHWQAGDMPFSAGELAECWARYWDVHTRGPHTIVRDEGIELPPELVPQIEDPYSGVPAYTSEAYDFLIQHGAEASDYERPYRWLLERADSHSRFVALTFPILAHAAFGSPDPVGVLCAAFERAWGTPQIRENVTLNTSHNINFDWLIHWSALTAAGVAPVLDELKLPSYTSGIAAIDRGPLSTHPVYAEAIQGTNLLNGKIREFRGQYGDRPGDDPNERHLFVSAGIAAGDPGAVFGLPGQPEYRYILGFAFPPAQVVFGNFTRTARRPIWLRLQEISAGKPDVEDYAGRIADLESRLGRFRRAEKAVSLGLPPDAFEAA
jgi:hypothetical protein